MCKFCPSYFAQKANLTIHMKSCPIALIKKSLVQNEQLNQQICDANFGDNNFMNQHISKVHDKTKELKCPKSKHSPNP